MLVLTAVWRCRLFFCLCQFRWQERGKGRQALLPARRAPASKCAASCRGRNIPPVAATASLALTSSRKSTSSKAVAAPVVPAGGALGPSYLRIARAQLCRTSANILYGWALSAAEVSADSSARKKSQQSKYFQPYFLIHPDHLARTAAFDSSSA